MWFFFFNDTATTEIYTLSLHDALPISPVRLVARHGPAADRRAQRPRRRPGATATRDERPKPARDRKSTRLNSSHANISYAVFCLKKNNELRATHLERAQICRSTGRRVT